MGLPQKKILLICSSCTGVVSREGFDDKVNAMSAFESRKKNPSNASVILLEGGCVIREEEAVVSRGFLDLGRPRLVWRKKSSDYGSLL